MFLRGCDRVSRWIMRSPQVELLLLLSFFSDSLLPEKENQDVTSRINTIGQVSTWVSGEFAVVVAPYPPKQTASRSLAPIV